MANVAEKVGRQSRDTDNNTPLRFPATGFLLSSWGQRRLDDRSGMVVAAAAFFADLAVG